MALMTRFFRRSRPARLVLSAAVALGISGAGSAQSVVPPPAPVVAATPLPDSFGNANRTAIFAGKRIAYRAVAEAFTITAPAGGAGARVSTYSYVARRGAAERPVVFIFNGGPGSSSAWLHMAALGPKRVILPESGATTTIAPEIVDNADCILDVADLVFIDPAGTGYSRLETGAKPADFYGVDEDARATSELIRQWLTRHDRWTSPRYLVGESYGTIRAAATLKLLMGGTAIGRFQAIDVGGVMLIGSVLDMAAARTGIDADQGQAMMLPSYAAIAWHYRLAGQGMALDAFLAEARSFARDIYLPALFQGDAIAAEVRAAVTSQLATFIGLPPEIVARIGLRIAPSDFATALLPGRRLSIYDARYAWPMADETGRDPVGEDPSMTRLGPTVLAGFMRYLRDDLGVRRDEPYEMISWNPNRQWKNQPERNFAADIGRAMRQNPAMRLVVIAGAFDLATPMGAAAHAVAHGDIPQDRTRLLDLQAGHMTYADDAARRSINQALREMITR